MPLYITETEQWRTPTATNLSPLLLQSSAMQIKFVEREEVQNSNTYSRFIQNIFEISNLHSSEQPYVFLPNTCPSLLFIIQGDKAVGYVSAPLTKCKSVFVPANGRVLCIQLKPGCLSWFTKRLPVLLTDQIVPFQKCFANAGTLLEQLSYIKNFHFQHELIIEFLIKENVLEYQIDPIVQQCIDFIHEKRGCCWVHEIAETTARSERFLSKTFLAATGLTMKTYCEIIKFLNSFYWILKSRPRTISTIVKKYGYFDLPHMNRSYQKFTNYTVSYLQSISVDEICVPPLIPE